MSYMYELYGKMDAGQRKVFFFALAVVGAVLFLLMPSPLSLVPHFGGASRPVARKPSPYRVAAPVNAAPVAPVRPATPPPQPVSTAGELLGNWRGSAPVGDRGMCNLALELKEPQPGQFAGYSNLACIPLTVAQRANASPALALQARNNAALALMLGKISPVSAILTGTQEGGSLKLHVDKNIGDPSACAMTSATITGFGTGRIAVDWKDGSCGGGSMVMGKVGR